MEQISRLNPLLEVLQSNPRRINKIFIQKERYQKKISEIIQQAKAQKIPYVMVPKQRLDRLAGNHQGVVAFLSPKEFSSLDDIMAGTEAPFLVLLDGVEDPQNLGAIIRTAEGAAVNGIILPERRSVGLTETVSKVSAGALEQVKIARVKNLVSTMDDLKKRGLWLVGAEGGRKEYWYEFDYNLPLGLVFGSEGRGLRLLVRKKCDKILSIPLLGQLSSLNVAAAASVFIFEVVRQRKRQERR
jgi:23S rRNA (guanosine2251-2'-O)-methyltransferase